jgi:UDP-N-acetylmuramate dehydrogenase
MDEKIKLLVSQLGENRVKTEVDLSQYLESGWGGPARAFFIATTSRELIRVVELCRELQLDFWVIGSGSKATVPESGFYGLVIKNRSDFLKIFGVKGKVSRAGIGIEEAFLEAESGVSLTRLSEFADQQGLAGLEILKGIPGTIGGSVLMNQVLRERIYQVKILDDSGEIISMSLEDLDKNGIIISVVFKLKAKKTA